MSASALPPLFRRSLLVAVLAGWPSAAHAHVKWFSEFSFADRPLRLAEAVTPTVVALLVFSMVVIGALVWVDRRVATSTWYERLDAWLASYRDRSLLVLRVGAGATLLLAWQDDSIFVPELAVPNAWVGWAQFGLALLLLSRRTTPVAGAGLLALYAYGFALFRPLHMLDYVFFAGVGFYLLVASNPSERISALGLPALYLSVGFSLCWVALEKLIYPDWGLYVLSQTPQLTLGFDIDFFLTAASFVEFSLGYLLIICLLQRPMALAITLVFFTTTLFFGKVEVIGHTLIHAALIVFLIEGPGTVYSAPYTFHKRPSLRTAFASVNVALLFAVLLVPYASLAWNAYEAHVAEVRPQMFELPPDVRALGVALDVAPEPGGGYLVRVDAEGFRFSPAESGGDHVAGEGHAHLYVDGEQVARLYAPVHHLTDLAPGRRTITVALSTNDHRLYARDGEVLRSERTIVVP